MLNDKYDSGNKIPLRVVPLNE